jgi:hypothetical protein
MRRTLLWLLALSLVVLVLAVVKVEHDRHSCPPGPWAHPIDRLRGGSHEYNVACVK